MAENSKIESMSAKLGLTPTDGGWFAVDQSNYDGAPDSRPPASLIGYGRTQAEAVSDLAEQLDDYGFSETANDITQQFAETQR